MEMYEFEHFREKDVVWWVVSPPSHGEMLFSFDKKTVYNLFQDYPHKLTEKERAIFDKENPFWKDFFKDRG